MSLINGVVYAAVPTTVTNPLSAYENLAQIFGVVTNIAVGVGVALTVVFLILGGIQYMMSKGDQKAATQARDWLTNAVIGFVVVLGALAIRVIIQNVIGAEGFRGDPTIDPGTGQ